MANNHSRSSSEKCISSHSVDTYNSPGESSLRKGKSCKRCQTFQSHSSVNAFVKQRSMVMMFASGCGRIVLKPCCWKHYLQENVRLWSHMPRCGNTPRAHHSIAPTLLKTNISTAWIDDEYGNTTNRFKYILLVFLDNQVKSKSRLRHADEAKNKKSTKRKPKDVCAKNKLNWKNMATHENIWARIHTNRDKGMEILRKRESKTTTTHKRMWKKYQWREM